MTNDDDWFEPKRFGYGAGLPVRWQGWALVAGHLGALALLAIALLPRDHAGLFVVLAVIASVPLLIISARHTRGGWRWRWRGENGR